MSTRQNRRSLSSGKALPPPHKNRPALANVTNNQTQLSHIPANTSILPSSNMAQCLAKIANVKKQSSGSTLPTSSNVKPSVVAIGKITRFATSDETLSRTIVPPVSCCMDISPNQSDGLSVSLGETMCTCDSLKSPEVEYIDDNVAEAINSIEREICSKVFISEHEEAEGNMLKGDIIANMGTTDKVVDVDENLKDPPFCATMVCDIFKHLQASEVKKRPSTDFMDWVQKDIDVSMRAILVDWLVEVAEEYRLVPDTLYLTVNYLDRYLSGNVMDRQQLQLLGVACMMIAAKYEEICPPEVVEFCYITDNTYSKEEVLQMESSVLNYLKFEMTAPTTKCFLRRFVCAAQGVTEAPSFQLECLANYLAELSLLEYSMLRFAPSQVAASAIFLANYMLLPAKRPWNLTLRHYTLYQPFDLCDCVKALHSLCCNRHHSSLPAIRVKYSQHKYKFVAKKYCPPSIPPEFFQNLNS